MNTCPFDPVMSRPKKGDAKAIQAINRGMRGILETTYGDYGHPARSVHAKSHGLVEGELTVLDGLGAELAQGVFAKPGTYPVVMRFSTNPGDILDDTVSSPRGVAMKVIGVEGERLPGSEGAVTQDFIMVNGPAFVAPDAAGFAKSLTMLAATTDTGQGWKKAISAVLRSLVRVKLAGPGAKALGGEPMNHPLGETFYTQTPFRYGNTVAKLSLAPVSAEMVGLKDQPVPLHGRPNGLRAALSDHFGSVASEWELRVQLRTNEATMPVEDASVVWPEAESPYVAVARVSVPRQPGWSEARAKQVDDGLAFSPWHGIAAHEPLGSINRARKESYDLSAGFRAEHTGCPMKEPAAKLGLSVDRASTYGMTRGREGRRPGTPDKRPGSWSQPLNPAARAVTAGAVGGLVAGVLVSGILVGMEQAQGAPAELVVLKRRTERRAGLRSRRGAPPVQEHAVAHGGHLALSVAAGAVYGAVRPESVPPAVAGAVFGAGFYGLAYGVTGPALGVTPPLGGEGVPTTVQRGLVHLVFGLATALVAQQVAKRI